MDTYIDLMDETDSANSLDYIKLIPEYTDWCTKVDNYDDSKCTDAELAYMIAVEGRVSSKMAKEELE